MRPRPGIQVDDRAFPIIVTRWLTHELDDEDVRAVHKKLDEVLARGAPFVTIVDGTRLKRMPPTRISRALERWVEDNETRVLELSCGTATIAKSVLARGVAHWVLQQRRVKTKGTVVKSFEEALDWAVERLRQRGVQLDDAHLTQLQDESLPEEKIDLRVGEIDEDRRALAELIIGAFAEPAFLVEADGAVQFMNAEANRVFPRPPPWLPLALSAGHDELKALCRVVPLELGRDLLMVIPSAELVPRTEQETPALDLPDSLRPVAELLAQGLSDKEISAYAELNLSTVRTYVTRIFKRTEVHSRGEFIRRYVGRPDAW